MAKYNWQRLRQKYVCGDYKSLKEFAEREGVEYKTLRCNATGWRTDRETKSRQKTDEIIEKTIAKQIENDVLANERHIAIWDKLLDIIEVSLSDEKAMKCFIGNDNMHSALKSMAGVVDKAQKGQRLGYGLDKGEGEKDNEERLLDSFTKIKKALERDDEEGQEND